MLFRMLWSPVTAGVFLASYGVMMWYADASAFSWVTLAVLALWLGLALYNWRTRGKLLALFNEDDQ